MLALPRAARLAAWATAWLHGRAPLDTVVDEVRGGGDVHEVVDLPGHPGAVGLGTGLAALRGLGATGVRAALPAPGDPLGLPGPPELTEAALDAGEAALLVGAAWAWVPAVQTYGPAGDTGTRVTWQVWAAEQRPVDVPGLADAEHLLGVAMREAAAAIGALGVAGADDATVAALAELRGTGAPLLPPGHGPRAARVAGQALRLLAVARLAADDGGTAVSAAQAQMRAGALPPLDRAARRALLAAVGAALEPSWASGRAE